MASKNKYTIAQNIERSTRYWLSCLLSFAFSPNHFRLYSWWVIGAIVLFFSAILILFGQRL
jgi:hypothetical protein